MTLRSVTCTCHHVMPLHLHVFLHLLLFPMCSQSLGTMQTEHSTYMRINCVYKQCAATAHNCCFMQGCTLGLYVDEVSNVCDKTAGPFHVNGSTHRVCSYENLQHPYLMREGRQTSSQQPQVLVPEKYRACMYVCMYVCLYNCMIEFLGTSAKRARRKSCWSYAYDSVSDAGIRLM
jgi:hypothetical protein